MIINTPIHSTTGNGLPAYLFGRPRSLYLERYATSPSST